MKKLAIVSAFLTFALCLLPSALSSVLAQVRDTPVAARATGSASIAGVVTTDDATPRPLRRVTVMLATGDIRMPEATVTDDSGAFAFGNLPAGNYTLVASRTGYVNSFYG